MHTSMAFAACNGDDASPLDWSMQTDLTPAFSFTASFLTGIKSQLLFKIKERQACESGCKEVRSIILYLHLVSANKL